MKILFLSTWFPYPPNQGSKTRAFHLLKALARRHSVAVVSFEDAPLKPEWRRAVEEMCPRVEVVREKPFARPRLRSWLGWFSPTPSAVVAGYSRQMSETVRAVAGGWNPDVVIAMTFAAAPYALEVEGVRRVVDVDNLLALMLREEYLGTAGPLRRARRYLAYRKLRRYERMLFSQFDLCLVTSALDCGRIREYIPLRDSQISLVPNGVDLEYFAPNGQSPDGDSLVFTGSLAYDPNRDAMEYFLEEIFPEIRRTRPSAHLTVTGAAGGAPLRPELRQDSVRFTGYLDDVRPVVRGSAASVAPLRKGAGTRLKILESMALGTPVVSTSKGAEGLRVEPGVHLLMADHASEFASQTTHLLTDPGLRASLAENARRLVTHEYAWDSIGGQFEQAVAGLG
jgi:sugar transferase (PEP-CTERM/EpsH1 system associated)